jgi:hypothetical protein
VLRAGRVGFAWRVSTASAGAVHPFRVDPNRM